MRYFVYQEPGGDRGEIYDTFYITDEEIMDEYWEIWKERMIMKYGDGPNEIIKPENALAEWINDNGAWEIDEEHYKTATKVSPIEWEPFPEFRYLKMGSVLVLQQKFVPKYSYANDVHEGRTAIKWVDVPTVEE